MNFEQIAGLVLGLGIGGAVGALAALSAAAGKVKRSVESFGNAFRRYFGGKVDAESQELRESFENLEADLQGLVDAANKAKRAWTRR